MMSFLTTFCPSVTGRWTSRPDTWNASSTFFYPSTLPGKVRTYVSSPATTTIILTGRTTSGRGGSCREHPTARQSIDKAIGKLGPSPLGPQSLAVPTASPLLTSALPASAPRKSRHRLCGPSRGIIPGPARPFLAGPLQRLRALSLAGRGDPPRLVAGDFPGSVVRQPAAREDRQQRQARQHQEADLERPEA
jgi:hypothetical protein